MTTNNEIPSESEQQVIDQLKNTKENIILTSSIFGLPEAYLKEYMKQSSANTIITITEMKEMHPQLMWQFTSYMESVLVLDFCRQLQDRKMKITQLKKIEKNILHNQTAFMMGKQPAGHKKNQELLDGIFEIVENLYDWEWIILNYDKPMLNSEIIQKGMYDNMTSGQMKHGPMRVLLSAYDEQLKNVTTWNDQFQVITIPEKITYEQVYNEALTILYNLYPKLYAYKDKIKHALTCLELKKIFDQENLSASIFMEGIRKFYEAYSCICTSGCLLTDIEIIVLIQDYIERVMNEQKHIKIKKPKLYI